jgi:hypothetical protein
MLRAMASLYPWFVFAHLVGLVLFAISHGASAYMAFRIRSDGDPHTVAALLDMSDLAKGPMYIGLVLILVGGAGAATIAGMWLTPWVIASIVVLFVVLAVMYSVATPYYGELRKAMGDPAAGVPATISPDELERRLATRRPEALLAVGTVGLVVLVWLMVLKPG